jgi:hypothetical protein
VSKAYKHAGSSLVRSFSLQLSDIFLGEASKQLEDAVLTGTDAL